MLLLNPGPLTLTERVRRSLPQPDLCHCESEFFDLQDEACSPLLRVHGRALSGGIPRGDGLDPGDWTAVLLTGSGTAAVESMVASPVPPSGRLLVEENGVYGERIAQICAQYRVAHERIRGPWMAALVHHETTGRLTDLKALAELCRAQDLRLLVDGVSSFGAEEIDFADSSLAAAVAATANECLPGVPGAPFVMVRRESLTSACRRTDYLDLGRLAGSQDQRNTPFTPAVHA